MFAQIDVGGFINGGLSAASDAGVVISTLVFLTVLVGCAAWVTSMIIGNIKEARAVAKAEKEAERAARAEERKATADALRDASHTNKELLDTNKELLDRLEQMAESQQQMADAHKQSNTNQESLTESIGMLMTAIENSEETRAQRFADMFQQRAEDHQAVVDVSAALQSVKSELAGLKEGVNTLEESVNNKIGLTESDRNNIKELVERTNQLLDRIKENEHAQATDPTHPTGAADPTGPRADAGADGGRDA
jgi:small-conductance mechanosensitive channel